MDTSAATKTVIEDLNQQIAGLEQTRDSLLRLSGASAAPVVSKPAPAAKAPAKPAAKKTAATKSAKPTGEKRDPAVLVKIRGDLTAHVTANPGQGVEEIGKALSMSTKEMTLPLRKLVKDGVLKTVGEKRATKYYAKNAKV